MRQPDKTEGSKAKEPAPKGFKRVGRPRICNCCGEPILRKDGKPAKRGRLCKSCKVWQQEYSATIPGFMVPEVA